MERRELYEPEDIEQLLIERPYDELLEEERAFVLRHLSGRDEYEAMRALLLKVHDDDGADPIDAEPSVRAHVMNVFRSEQRPQWRIWLNSAQVFLLPKQASAMWRPALALGSVALVVFLIANRGRHAAEAPQLAELKEVKATEEARNEQAAAQKTEPAPPAEPAVTQKQPAAGGVTRAEGATALAKADEPNAVDEALAETAVSFQPEQPAPPPAEVAVFDAAQAEDLPTTTGDLNKKAITLPLTASTPALDCTIAVSGTATHIVTSNELSYNFSAAAADQARTLGTVSVQSATRFSQREKAKKQEMRNRIAAWTDDSGEATADAGPYLDLLRAAW